MTDRLPSSDYRGRISQLGSGNLEEINAVYNPREFFVDTRNWTVAIHDGATPGGHWLARADFSNVASSDIINQLENIPVTKLALNTYEGTFISEGGNDVLSGNNPQLAKVSLGGAAAVDSSGFIFCQDASNANLSSFSGKRVEAPYATFNMVSNVTLSNGAVLHCFNLIGSSAYTLTIEEGCKLIVDGTVSGTDFITGAGSVYIGNYTAACFKDTFQGDYSTGNSQQPMWTAFESLKYLEGNGVVTCDGGTTTLTAMMNPLKAQMQLYLDSGGTKGIATRTRSATANGTIKGSYFIWDKGASTCVRPLIRSTSSNGAPNYSSELYNGSLFTSNKSWSQPVFISATAAGPGGSTAHIIISDPNGTQLENHLFYGHFTGSSSGCSSGQFIIPANYHVRFNKNGLAYRDNCVVWGYNQSSFSNFMRMRIY